MVSARSRANRRAIGLRINIRGFAINEQFLRSFAEQAFNRTFALALQDEESEEDEEDDEDEDLLAWQEVATREIEATRPMQAIQTMQRDEVIARALQAEEDRLLVARLRVEHQDEVYARTLQGDTESDDAYGNSDRESNAGADDDADDTTCVVCMASPINATLLPCNHRNICVTCAKRVRARLQSRCPVCRDVFTTIVED